MCKHRKLIKNKKNKQECKKCGYELNNTSDKKKSIHFGKNVSWGY